MKHSSTHSCRPAEFAVALLLIVALASMACVTRGTHQVAVNERDRLREDRDRLERRMTLLEASNESLGSERAQLIDEMEDLRQAREILERDVRSLRSAEAELSENLAAREAELATRSQEFTRLRGTYEGLVSDLEEEVASGQIQIEQLREGLRLNVSQDVLFASGSARLNMAGESVIWKVAERLKAIPHSVEVQGHTDNIPLRGSAPWPTNWELAAARATEVVRLFEKRGVDPERLTAVSYGAHNPVASNESAEGRAKNRRIEIRLSPTEKPVAAGDEDAS